MGMKRRIEVYKMSQTTLQIPSGQELNAHGRLAWLQRMLWHWLEKMGALNQAYRESVEVIRLPLTADEILDRIVEQYEGLFEVDRIPKEVLIGSSTLADLLSCDQLRHFPERFGFDADVEYTLDKRRDPTAPRRRRIYNLPITVVPQMDGVLVLDR